jgi:hypothetical protein
VYIRYYFEENIHEEFMFGLPLSKRCTGKDKFTAVNEYFATEFVYLLGKPVCKESQIIYCGVAPNTSQYNNISIT